MFLNPRRTRAGVSREGSAGFSQGRRRSTAASRVIGFLLLGHSLLRLYVQRTDHPGVIGVDTRLTGTPQVTPPANTSPCAPMHSFVHGIRRREASSRPKSTCTARYSTWPSSGPVPAGGPLRLRGVTKTGLLSPRSAAPLPQWRVLTADPGVEFPGGPMWSAFRKPCDRGAHCQPERDTDSGADALRPGIVEGAGQDGFCEPTGTRQDCQRGQYGRPAVPHPVMMSP